MCSLVLAIREIRIKMILGVHYEENKWRQMLEKIWIRNYYILCKSLSLSVPLLTLTHTHNILKNRATI